MFIDPSAHPFIHVIYMYIYIVSGERQVPKISITSTTSSTSGGRRDSKGRRPMDLELSPLVIRGESHSPSPGIVISPRTGSHVPMPGTPV